MLPVHDSISALYLFISSIPISIRHTPRLNTTNSISWFNSPFHQWSGDQRSCSALNQSNDLLLTKCKYHHPNQYWQRKLWVVSPCQLCHGTIWSLCQPQIPPVMIKLALWKLTVFNKLSMKCKPTKWPPMTHKSKLNLLHLIKYTWIVKT